MVISNSFLAILLLLLLVVYVLTTLFIIKNNDMSGWNKLLLTGLIWLLPLIGVLIAVIGLIKSSFEIKKEVNTERK